MPIRPLTPPPTPPPPANSPGSAQVRRTLSPNRNTVTTIREDGSRRFLHPADAKGVFTLARRASAWVLIGVYLLLPWVRVGQYPAVFFDVGARRFHLFGATLAVQDLWLMFFVISGLGFSLFLVTSLLGRVWCGWACPQTVFLDHVFRRFERLIEGDAPQRRALDTAPWTLNKILRRSIKHAGFILFSAGIAHLFLAYFVSIPDLWHMMRTAPGLHWSSFVFVFVATGILYFNFAWFREQLCIVVCPYGRLQSALIDDHSLVIGYDVNRGEPRGKLHTPNAGACIDCNRCVQVCPTGIDIRQGLQIECIGCAACIDACDQVMVKVNRPTGLIRYDSAEGFAGRRTRLLRARTIVYSVLLLVGAGVGSWAFSTLRPAEMSVTRMRAAPYIVDQQYVRNQYLVRLINKRDQPTRFILRPRQLKPGIITRGFETTVEVGPLGEEVRPYIVQVPRGQYAGTFTLMLQVTDEPRTFTLNGEVEFLGPDPELLKEDGAK